MISSSGMNVRSRTFSRKQLRSRSPTRSIYERKPSHWQRFVKHGRLRGYLFEELAEGSCTVGLDIEFLTGAGGAGGRDSAVVCPTS